MLVQQRKAHLLDILQRTGRIIAKEVSHTLNLSEDTIRRDLRDLAKDGVLTRVHGGAVPISPATAPFNRRTGIGNAEKSAIGQHAASLIETGQVVFLDSGTTALQLARHLPKQLRATIVTHSPNIAMQLLGFENLDVEIVGGRLFAHSIVTVGAATLVWLDRYRPAVCFIGATGIHPDDGITTGNAEEAEVKRAVIARSGTSYILASSEKIGAVSAFKLADCDQVDGVIGVKTANQSIYDQLLAKGCDVLLAGQ